MSRKTSKPDTARKATGRPVATGRSRNRAPVTSRKDRPWGWYLTLALILVGAAAAISYAVVSRPSTPHIAGVRTYSNLSRSHVTGPVSYPQTPPVGGNHAAVPLNCGVYDRPVPNENAVHSLEHGALWITYRPALPAAQLSTLKGLVQGNDHRLLSPYPGLPQPIVATAWGVQLGVGSADDPRLAQFVGTDIQGPTTPESGAACVGVGTPTG